MAVSNGADKAAALRGDQVILSADFRAICQGNACGNYGQCYMCPPDVGDIHALMAKVRSFETGIMYQAVYPLEDSFDFEGMQAAGAAFNAASRGIHHKAARIINVPWLHLAAGGCRSCEVCAKRDGLPCRKPEEALPSLEAYGVDVYHTASNAGLSYIHGKDTVTYFGMLLM